MTQNHRPTNYNSIVNIRRQQRSLRQLQQAVCDVAVLPCISDDKPHCLSHIAFKTGLPDEWGDTDWRYGKFPASPEAAQ